MTPHERAACQCHHRRGALRLRRIRSAAAQDTSDAAAARYLAPRAGRRAAAAARNVI
jgi:hypothetical protein